MPANKGLGTKVSGRELISGSGLSVIDGKGRVSIPPDLRNAVIANSAERSFYLGKQSGHAALVGYDKAALEDRNRNIEAAEMSAAANGVPEYDFGARSKTFPSVEPVPFDTSGRFVLSAKLRARAQLDNLAFFAGFGRFFCIWNPFILIERADIDEDLREDARWALKEKGLA